MNLKECERLGLQPLTGHWYRAVRLKFWRTRLSTEHTRTAPSRFSTSPPARADYRILYLGETHQVVLYEVGALLGEPTEPVPKPGSSVVVMCLRITLDKVADLTDLSQQRLLKTSAQELTGIWGLGPSWAPTQQLGVALESVAGLEGFIVPGSKPPGRNLVVFPDKLGPRSSIVFHNELTGRDERLT
jgi:hypothetical protein